MSRPRAQEHPSLTSLPLEVIAMDIIGSAAAVIGVAQLGARVLTALSDYGSSFKGAEASCKKLGDHIRLCVLAENTLRSVVQSIPPSSRTLDVQRLIDEWNRPGGPPEECRQQLEDLLKSVLLEGIQNGTKMKILAKFKWHFKKQKIEAAIRAYEGYKPYFSDVLSICNTNTIQNGLKKEEQRRKEEAKSDLLKWIDGFDCTNKHEFTFRQRQDTTCDWLFREDLYTEWRSVRKNFIWLHGNPGMGKSVLASAVINELSGPQHEEPLGEAIAYFYCDFRESRCTSAMEVLRSLIAQLLRKSRCDWLPLFTDLTERKERGSGPPADLGILSDVLKRAAKLHEHPILVIDALDECETVQDLLPEVVKLNDECCQLFVTSRTLQPIKEAFAGLPSISLSDKLDEIQNDILVHITREIESRRMLKTRHQDIKDHIRDALMKKAAGMFRWAQCQLDMLNECVSERDIYEVLDSLPETLYGTYDHMLQAIDKKKYWRRVAQRVFRWLVLARPVPKLAVLAQILAIDWDKDVPSQDSQCALDTNAILEICGSFVQYHAEYKWITLSHYSVKEYLTSETPANRFYFVDPPRAMVELVSVSLFSMMLLRDKTSDPWAFALPGYTAPYILPLLRDCVPEANERLIQQLLALQDHFSSHPDFYYRYLQRQISTSPTMLHHLALCIILRFGPMSMLQQYLERVSARDLDGDSPLAYAAHFCDLPRVQLLLEKGVDVNALGTFFNDWGTHNVQLCRVSPLVAAAWNQKMENIETLFTLFQARGYIVPQDAVYSVLQVDHSHYDLNTIRLLLKNGADPNFRGARGRSALHQVLICFPLHSAGAEVLPLAQELVDAGCDPTLLDDDGVSPFHHAIERRAAAVVEWLVAKGFQPPQDALLYALQKHTFDYQDHCEAMIRILHVLVTSAGAAVDVQDARGNGVLHFLASTADVCPDDSMESAVSLLVGAGCDINGKSHDHETPLHIAARFSPRLQVLHIFISQGAKLPVDIINSAVRYCGETLNGEQRVNTFLTPLVEKYGASCRSITVNGDNALHCQLSHRRSSDAIISFLLANGCDGYSLNIAGYKPWHVAIEHGSPASIPRSLCVPDDTTPFSVDHEGNNVLHRISYNMPGDQFVERMKLLHESGFDIEKHINAPNHKGFTPLCLALHPRRFVLQIVTCLLEHRAKFSDVHPLLLENLDPDQPWYRAASDAYQLSLSRPKPTFADVTRVYQLLRTIHQGRLAPPIVRLITDMATYWGYATVSRTIPQPTTHHGELIWFPTPPCDASSVSWTPRRVLFLCSLRDTTLVSNAFGRISIYILRQNKSYKIPIELTSLKFQTAFDVWDEHTAAQSLDGTNLALADVTSKDPLCVQYTCRFDATAELDFRMEVCYTIGGETVAD